MDVQLPQHHDDEVTSGVKDAKKDQSFINCLLSALAYVFPVSGFLAATCVLGWIMVSLTQGEGILNCPGDPVLPVYLLGTGTSFIIALFLAYSPKVLNCCSSPQSKKVLDMSFWIVFIFYYFCSIAGCIWMFAKYGLFKPQLPTSYCSSIIQFYFRVNVLAFLLPFSAGILVFILVYGILKIFA